MSTLLLPWRITCVCPTGMVDTVKAWYFAVVGEGDILMSKYSASGIDPAQYHGVSGNVSNDQVQNCLVAMCDGTTITPPSNWAKWALSTQKKWISNNLASLQQQTGYVLAFDDLTSKEWTWIGDILEAHGLKPIMEKL